MAKNTPSLKPSTRAPKATTQAPKRDTSPPDDALSTKEVAEAIGTTPTKLRVFLRASDEWTAVGAGSRYAFTKADLPKLKKGFTAWATADDKKKADRKARLDAERAASKATTTPPSVEDDAPAEDDDVEEMQEAG